MIFKDKTEFTSDPFTVEDNKIFVTVANKGAVYLEVLEQDAEWRSFPQTTLLGPVSKYIAVPSEMSLRIQIPTLNTVSAYKAVAVEVIEEEPPVDPADPEEPVDPPTEEPPVDEPEEPPVEEEPETPEEPPVDPVQYETITTTPNNYDSEWWSNGVWINTDRSGINIPNTDPNLKAFVPGAVVKFSDASEKMITQVQVVGANISVWFEGTKLSPALGYPATVSVQVVKEPVVVIPESNLKAAGPSFGMNFASGTFSDHDVTKLPGVYNTHYTYPTANTFSRWKARGVKHVRLPIRWERIQPSINTPLDNTESARILAVYDMAADNDMVIVLDLHNYMQRNVGGTKYEIGTPQVPQAAYNELWVRLVALVGSHKASYGYGIMNEPMGTQGRWTPIAQSVVNAIRAVDPTTYIFVNGDQWATPLNWVTANPGFPLQGENIVYEAHLYFDKNAGGSYSDANEQIDPQVGVNRLTPYINWGIKYKKPLVVGEVGWPANRPTAEVAARNALTFAAEHNVRVFGWMAGEWLDANNVLSIEVNGAAQPQLAIYQETNKNIEHHGPQV